MSTAYLSARPDRDMDGTVALTRAELASDAETGKQFDAYGAGWSGKT